MSCIHYKFKSSLDYNSVTFDGLHLSLADLKKAISQQKRLKPGEYDLEITNAQTGDVYKRSDELIAKNTSVIVSRVPVNRTTASSTQKSWEAFKQECAKVKEKERQMTLEKQKQISDLTSAQASEIDKIKAVIDQSTKGFEPSNFVGKYQPGVPHDNYVCKRCGQKGHFVSNCPNTNPEDRIIEPRYKRTTGIPSTMLTIVDDPMHPGALLTHHGQFAVPTVDVQGYRDSKKERPPFLPDEKQSMPEKKKIPQELLCHICEDLCVDAAIAPCCGTSFCDECLREVLLESDDHQCPSCKETNVSPDRIVANRSMRLAVTNFLNDTGYTKVKRRRSNSQGGDVSLPAVLSALDRATSTATSVPSNTAGSNYNTSPNVQASAGSSPNASASPTYTDLATQKQSQILGAVRPYAPRTQFSNSGRPNVPGQQFPGVRTFNPQYSYTRPPRFPPNHHSKPWRYSSETTATETSTISTISRRNEPGPKQHHQPGSYPDEPPPASKPHQSDNGSTTSTEMSYPGEPAAPGTAPIERSRQEPVLPKPTSSWSTEANQPPKATVNSVNTPIATLNLGLLVPQRMPLITVPPAGHQPFTAVAPGFPQRFPGMRQGVPAVPQAGPDSQPLSKEQFYQAKKMFQATDAPRKPVDVFESFADFTKRRSRTPERRRSYSRSRSGSWTKRSRSRSFSPSKRKSRSLSLRRLTSRSRSKSGPRSQNRSRSRSGPRSQNRTRSRSREPLRLSRQRSRTRSPRRLTKSRSRSRSGQRLSKALSPRPRSPLPPLRRSSKSPLPPLRSRSRSLRRLSRSRSKSWTKRARSRSRSRPRSHSRPRSPARYSRSPVRSPRRSPLRSPLRKRSFSPRRRSRSFSPRRRSPFRSRSRTPLAKRRSPRSRTRSPPPKRHSYSPLRSPRRSKSPYKKPLSPIPFRPRSPSPFRGRGGYNRGRGRGGYRDFNKDNRDNRFRGYPSPPRAPISGAPNQPLPNANLPPVPYFPQMGLPPPEEYFKYNPAGYQEFVRNFYSQFGPQAQAWAQNQTFPLPTGDGYMQNPPVPNSAQPSQRPPWEPIPMSPSHRPRSITPPGAAPRDRRAPNYQDRDGGGGRPWDKDRERQDRERQDRERQDRDRERDRRADRGGRDMDRNRREGDRRDRVREDERNRSRDYNKDKENKEREKENARNRSKTSSDRKRSPPKKSKEDEKLRTREKKKTEKKKDEKEVKRSKKESEDKKESISREIHSTKAKDNEEGSVAVGKIDKAEEKRDSKDAFKPKNEDDSQSNLGQDDAKRNLTNVADSEKPIVKEKKLIGKKKGDGVGTKKKSKDAGADTAGGEKKGKKIKKKKLTFGSSEADAKQGLKKKKLKRLVDYKSENYTSEEGGEERASLRGSPLKKAKHNNNVVPPPEKTELVDSSHVSSSEPTFEVSADQKLLMEDEKKHEFELEATVSQSDGDEKELEGTGKGKGDVIPDLPELSKWEREDFDLFDAMEKPKEKPQEKMMLPRSVVDKAEKFLTHKPMKNAVMVAQVTTSTKSPEPATEKQTVEPKSSKSPPQSKTSRRVFIDQKKDSKEKKGFDMQITVKSEKRREPDKKSQSYSKSDDQNRHHHHHHLNQDESNYEEDQRSVVKSRSFERELQDHSSSSKTLREKEKQRKDRTSRDSISDRVGKQEPSKRERYEKKERQPERSLEPKNRRHSKERKTSTSTSEPSSKSSKDLRHKLEEKSKTKSAVDQRKLSVMDESEFIPDYEDLAPEGFSDNEQDDATTSQNSGGSSPDTSPHKSGKKRKVEEDDDDEDGSQQNEDDQDTSEEAGKHKKKKKHKHKEKNKEKKEKHKHKKKKHKHKKEKEGKKKANKGEES